MPRRKRLVIPDQIKLNGRIWTVHMETTDRMKEEDLDGECIFTDRELHIRPRRSRKEREATYVHEVVHALLEDVNLDEKVEEKVVRGLEYSLREALLNGALAVE
jgi:hypothetical protein